MKVGKTYLIEILKVSFAAIGWLMIQSVCDAGEPSSNRSDPRMIWNEHWSFQPLKKPDLPKVKRIFWCRNPIDRFILAKCESHSINPTESAPRMVLARRVCFDLLGLPPTPGEVKQFLDDDRPGAYNRFVERLFASHHFGIKRGQHWLDLARFAETDGFEHDKIRNDAWKYRDWVIDAFNSDLPLDQFISMQLAGDELESDSGVTATGFCLSGPDMPDINSQEERRQNVLNEMTSTIGSTLLGLQVGCAQCHDHKYDPISQKDFYQLRAIFEPALKVKKNQSLGFLHEKGKKSPKSYLMIRGDWKRKGEAVSANIPSIFSKSFTFRPRELKSSSGRRSGFADWLTHDQNPLTARVMVNRIWQYHFGTGLVSTASDFGLMGETPTHPKLLDWLAVELIENNWSSKHISKLIMTSSTYRQTTPGFFRSYAGEEKNLMNRFPFQRLSGESIRDAMIAASGSSNFSMGGKGVMPPIPEELRKTLLKNQWTATKNRADHFKRSIYVFARRNLRYPIFEAFDRPDGNLSCARRNQSTTAPQSLHLLNSELSLDLSRRLAGDILSQKNSKELAIKEVFWRVLSRPPTDHELKNSLSFIARQANEIRTNKSGQIATPIPTPENIDSATAAALTYLCLAIFNTNEFIFID